MRMRSLLWLGLVAGMSGCVGLPESLPSADASYEPPEHAMQLARVGGGGLYSAGSAWTLTADKRAFRPGDVLTVSLEETTQASKTADTSFSKNSNAAIQPTVIAGHTFKTDVGVGAKRDFTGSGTSSQQNTLQGSLTVIVQKVLPNGLLQVRGEKILSLNQGEEVVRLAGYVRRDDIDADNHVSSQRVANARIQYAGKGALADSNNAGWLTRFFNSPWMPM